MMTMIFIEIIILILWAILMVDFKYLKNLMGRWIMRLVDELVAGGLVLGFRVFGFLEIARKLGRGFIDKILKFPLPAYIYNKRGMRERSDRPRGERTTPLLLLLCFFLLLLKKFPKTSPLTSLPNLFAHFSFANLNISSYKTRI